VSRHDLLESSSWDNIFDCLEIASECRTEFLKKIPLDRVMDVNGPSVDILFVVNMVSIQSRPTWLLLLLLLLWLRIKHLWFHLEERSVSYGKSGKGCFYNSLSPHILNKEDKFDIISTWVRRYLESMGFKSKLCKYSPSGTRFWLISWISIVVDPIKEKLRAWVVLHSDLDLLVPGPWAYLLCVKPYSRIRAVKHFQSIILLDYQATIWSINNSKCLCFRSGLGYDNMQRSRIVTNSPRVTTKRALWVDFTWANRTILNQLCWSINPINDNLLAWVISKG